VHKFVFSHEKTSKTDQEFEETAATIAGPAASYAAVAIGRPTTAIATFVASITRATKTPSVNSVSGSAGGDPLWPSKASATLGQRAPRWQQTRTERLKDHQ
jgi:hypothetical protein